MKYKILDFIDIFFWLFIIFSNYMFYNLKYIKSLFDVFKSIYLEGTEFQKLPKTSEKKSKLERVHKSSHQIKYHPSLILVSA